MKVSMYMSGHSAFSGTIFKCLHLCDDVKHDVIITRIYRMTLVRKLLKRITTFIMSKLT